MKWVTFSMIAGLALAAIAHSASAQDRFSGAPKGAAFYKPHIGQMPETQTVVFDAQKASAESKGKKVKPERSLTLNSKTAYDDWRNRSGENGEVVSEAIELKFVSENVNIEDEEFSVTLNSAYVWSSATRDDDSGSTGHLSDTKLAISYERPLPGSESWLGAIMPTFNLPTGLTEASDTERLARPAPGVTTKSYLGTGFDAGLIGKLTWKLDEDGNSTFFVGGGATRRGNYDTTEADPPDADGEVSSGLVYNGFIGLKGFPAGFATVDLKGTYIRNQGYADTISNDVRLDLGVKRSFQVGEPSKIVANSDKPLQKNLGLGFTYGLSAKDEQPERATLAERDEDTLEGAIHRFGTSLAYRFGDTIELANIWSYRWTLNAALDGSFGDTSKPQDQEFFSTNWSFGAKAGVAYRISPNSSISASLRRAETGAESSNNSDDGKTRFSSWTGLIGVNIAF